MFKEEDELNEYNFIPLIIEGFEEYDSENVPIVDRDFISNEENFEQPMLTDIITSTKPTNEVQIKIESQIKKAEVDSRNIEKIIKKILGKPINENIDENRHNKFSIDNIRKKLISIIINILYDFINSKLENKKLKKINSKNFIKAEEAIKLPKKTLKEIFSNDLNDKYSKYINRKNYNEKLISKLEEKNDKIMNIFNCTLSQCLKYFIKDSEIFNNPHYSFLEGLDDYFNELENLEKKETNNEQKEYLNKIIEIIKNFENNLFNVKPRHSKKVNINE